ncbi:hypothetical protein Bca101_069596 [Brassica carinata]
MVSGVGPSAQLQAQNITVVMDQPHVGQGMHDNPMNAVFIPSPVPVEVSLIEVVGITGEGTYVEAAGESNSLKLSSAQPFQGGFILEKPDDLKRCVRGIQTIERVVQSKAFARYKYADMSFEYLLNLTASTPVNLRPPRSGPGASLPPSAEEFCQLRLQRFGITMEDVLLVESSMGIIRLLVYTGLGSLICQTVGYCPGTNPQATVMMLGRYMGVKITRERLANK